MAKKDFDNLAQESVSQDLPITEDMQPAAGTKAQYQGTKRIANARQIPIEKIKPDPDQPRKHFDEESLKELAASIAKHGVKQPISVEYVEKEDYFKINVGERRWRASQLAGLKEIPCIIEKIDREKRLAVQLMENIQRQDLSPIEKARGLLEYKMSLGKDAVWKNVEEEIGLSKRRRAQLMELLDLPEEIQTQIVAFTKKQDNQIFTEKHARSLLMLKDQEEKMFQLFNEILSSKEPISGNDAIKMAKEIKEANRPKLHTLTIKYTTQKDLIKQLKEKLKEL